MKTQIERLQLISITAPYSGHSTSRCPYNISFEFSWGLYCMNGENSNFRFKFREISLGTRRSCLFHSNNSNNHKLGLSGCNCLTNWIPAPVHIWLHCCGLQVQPDCGTIVILSTRLSLLSSYTPDCDRTGTVSLEV